MGNKHTFVFVSLLRSKYKEFGDSWPKVEESITRKIGEKVFDRRKLKRLCESDDVKISKKELIALDNYFSPTHSLTRIPIFEKPQSILEQYLYDQSTIHILIQTRYFEEIQTETISAWDMKSLQKFLQSPFLTHAKMTIEDVPHHRMLPAEPLKSEKEKLRYKRKWIEQINTDPWNKKLHTDHSLISLGSPFVSHSSEQLIAIILGLRAWYKPEQYDPHNLLPFYLIWPENHASEHQGDCCTLMDMDTFRNFHPDQVEEMDLHHRAFLIKNKVYISRRDKDSYGLLIAKRTADNRVFMVILGAHGISTLGISQALNDNKIQVTIPKKKDSMTTAVIKCTQRIHKNKLQNQRKLENVSLIDDVLLWQKVNDQWKSDTLD